MKLYAISDLHLLHAANRTALLGMAAQPEDWLIVAGDVGETEKLFTAGMALLARRFARVFWTPGNHDLWTLPSENGAPRGVAKYERLVAVCRELGILTPEDPFVRWPNGPLIAPIFTLYDYSFRPDDVPAEAAVSWAIESGVLCNDEYLLHPDPHPSREAWSAARVRYTNTRLQEAAGPLILVSHFPLRQDLVRLKRIPRFSIWCGTRATESWHTRYPVQSVIYGHLHIRGTHFRDGVRFESVSLGYPYQWQPELGIKPYLRQILPGG